MGLRLLSHPPALLLVCLASRLACLARLGERISIKWLSQFNRPLKKLVCTPFVYMGSARLGKVVARRSKEVSDHHRFPFRRRTRDDEHSLFLRLVSLSRSRVALRDEMKRRKKRTGKALKGDVYATRRLALNVSFSLSKLFIMKVILRRAQSLSSRYFFASE